MRRIFDCAAEADRYESELESVRSDHEAELERLRPEYEPKIEHLEARVSELQEQLRAANTRNEDHQKLVRYVKTERELERQRERRRGAAAWKRAKWWLFGVDETAEL